MIGLENIDFNELKMQNLHRIKFVFLGFYVGRWRKIWKCVIYMKKIFVI